MNKAVDFNMVIRSLFFENNIFTYDYKAEQQKVKD